MNTLFAQIEKAAIQSWPTLHRERYRACQLLSTDIGLPNQHIERRAGSNYPAGYSMRLNSVLPLVFEDGDPSGLGRDTMAQELADDTLSTYLDYCEKYYQAQGLPCAWKLFDNHADGKELIPGSDDLWLSLDQVLAQRSYQILHPSCLMWIPTETLLAGLSGQGQTEGQAESAADLLAKAGLSLEVQSGFAADWAASKPLQATVQRISVPTWSAALRNISSTSLEQSDGQSENGSGRETKPGELLGRAYVALAEGQLGLFCVEVQAELRGRGIATAMLQRLFAQVFEQATGEIVGCYLQVEKDNPVALGLYEKLSFQKLYSYHYRAQAWRWD